MEKKVYLIDLDKETFEENVLRMDDERWKKVSIKQLNVYSLWAFCHSYNWEAIDITNTYIRIL